MTGDETKFKPLNKHEGSVTFGANGTSNIVGKGTLSIDNGSAKVKYVMCVEELKQNILSVIHICDQGHTVTFES
jgi:hypothetical protein